MRASATRVILVWAVTLATCGPLAHAIKPELTLEDITAAVDERWKDVRDLAVTDRTTLIEYRRFSILTLPKTSGAIISPRPNVWRVAPGLEYLEIWQGAKSATIAYDGEVTRWQGRRTAFSPPRGRIRAGCDVPFDDISFSYYVGRFGRVSGLADFLSMPNTRLVKANLRIDEIPCVRVEGLCPLSLDGVEKQYVVRMDLAPQYGWLPVRTRFTDAETGFPVRDYKARSFFNLDTFPFPRQAQVDLYEVAQSARPNAVPKPMLVSSLVYDVEKVAVNQGLGPADFVFGFEPGAEVTDERTGEVIRLPAAAPQ